MPDVDSDTSDVLASKLDLACVQPSADLNSGGRNGAVDLAGAPNGASRSVERGKKSIACRLDLPPPMSRQLAADDRFMTVEHRSPSPVPEFGCSDRGVDDIREQHRRHRSFRRRGPSSTRDELLGVRDDGLGVTG